MNNDANSPLSHPMTEDDIANYLANTPDFFERHAELLGSVQLTSPHGNRAVSLQERQAEMLRDKIKAYERRVMEMIRNGNENGLLADKLLNWTRSLFLADTAAELPAIIASEISDQFMVPQVAIKVWGVAAQHASSDFATGVSDDAKSFANSLTEPFCGLNTGFEAVNWLFDPKQAVSIALLPVRAEKAFGLIVLASSDAQRFHADMGTDFLQKIAEISSAALSRLR